MASLRPRAKLVQLPGTRPPSPTPSYPHLQLGTATRPLVSLMSPGSCFPPTKFCFPPRHPPFLRRPSSFCRATWLRDPNPCLSGDSALSTQRKNRPPSSTHHYESSSPPSTTNSSARRLLPS